MVACRLPFVNYFTTKNKFLPYFQLIVLQLQCVAVFFWFSFLSYWFVFGCSSPQLHISNSLNISVVISISIQSNPIPSHPNPIRSILSLSLSLSFCLFPRQLQSTASAFYVHRPPATKGWTPAPPAPPAPVAYFWTILTSRSVENDLGRSMGRPRARSQTREASTPRARETPNNTV